jgi:hypothetical protein
VEGDSDPLLHSARRADVADQFAGDATSPQAIMRAFYASTSGPPGERHDWRRFRNLYLTYAQTIALLPDPQGVIETRTLSIDEYVAAATPNLEQRGFQEQEIGHQTVRYGALAHVWSAYEAQHGSGAARIVLRGINSVQLAHIADRWWIMNVTWTNERSAGPVPDALLSVREEAGE